VAIGEILHLPARYAFGLVDLGAFSCQDHLVGSLGYNVDEFNGLAVSPETFDAVIREDSFARLTLTSW